MSDYPSMIRRISAKDEQAFAELYELTRNAVYSIIYAIVRNRQATEDLMQETYLKMIHSLHQYNGSVHFKTWLLTIAKNLAIDYYRREKKTVLVELPTLDSIRPQEDHRAEHQLESERFLALLDEEERQIVLLKINDRMTHRQIADLMQKPLGTIMWMYNRALKKMQKAGKEDRHA